MCVGFKHTLQFKCKVISPESPCYVGNKTAFLKLSWLSVLLTILTMSCQ